MVRWEIRLFPKARRLVPFALIPVFVLYGLLSDRFHKEGWEALVGADAPFTLLFTLAALSAVTTEVVKTFAFRRVYLFNVALVWALLAAVRWLWSFSF